MDAASIAMRANFRRADVITMINKANAGHIGGSLSSLDIISVLYDRVMNIDPKMLKDPNRDRFLLSKGHSVEGYLVVLADKGFFPKEELREFSQAGSHLIGHPNNKVPGIEMCTGALGHGLSIGVGMALAAKRLNRTYRTFVLLGDGELAEGSVWEAAMAGANYRLDNLFAIIDRNGLQISGDTEDVMALENLAEKWTAFGWNVTEVDGHDVQAMMDYFSSRKAENKPHCLICKTIKCKGLPAGENKKEWHHKVPNEQQVKEALEALGVKEVDWL
ncbi:MAG: transketolase [Christensenellaceae bacterium]|nr:transketolase [Christensenellaceae bacterium]